VVGKETAKRVISGKTITGPYRDVIKTFKGKRKGFIYSPSKKSIREAKYTSFQPSMIPSYSSSGILM